MRLYLICADTAEGVHPADDYQDYDEHEFLPFDDFCSRLKTLSPDEVIFSKATHEQLVNLCNEYHSSGFSHE